MAGQHSKIVVQTDQWEHLNALTQHLAKKKLRSVGFDRNPLSLCDTARTHIKLGGKAFLIEVTVVDNITADVILVMDFLALIIAWLMSVGRCGPNVCSMC